MTVQHVRQEDANGCLVACLSMVTGRPYSELRAYFIRLGKTLEGERGGINEIDVEHYLADHSFAVAKKYRWLGHNIERPVWPVSPFAPVHIVLVRTSQWHGVVLLPDGRVLDPLSSEPHSLSDYSEVANVVGVFKIADGKAVA